MRKSKLREFQDRRENQGWRIKSVPFDDSSDLRVIPPNWPAMAGLFLTFAGIWLYYRKENLLYLKLAGASFVFSWLAVLFRAKNTRRGWIKVKAVCRDKEIAANGPRVWCVRLLCTFELNGRKYTVTPDYWRSFGSEERAQRFLSKAIAADGTCLLFVNPKQPRQTELAAKDLLQLLLH